MVLVGSEINDFETPIGTSAGFRVTFDSSYGVSGTAICDRVVVVDATACDQSGEMMTDLEQS